MIRWMTDMLAYEQEKTNGVVGWRQDTRYGWHGYLVGGAMLHQREMLLV